MSCRILAFLAAAVCIAVMDGASQTKSASSTFPGSRFLFVWSADAARQSSDFLTVIDANPSSAGYGRFVATLPIGAEGTMPHHTEYEFPQDNLLFANSWVAGRTFVFDLNNPLQPRIAAQFQDRAGYRFPHSFVRLPNGHRLGTFQSYGEGYAPGGGLVEVDASGNVVRSASAVDPALSKDLIWPYSLIVAPQFDLVVSSSTPMGWPEWAKEKLPAGSWPFQAVNDQITAQVQLWRLSNLHLLRTVTLPPDGGKHDQYPAEPRVLPDGSIYVNTFHCGLYRMKDVNGTQPSAELVHTFPGGDSDHTMCAVSVVVSHYWIQTVGALPGLIVLDISHPEKPVEVSRLKLDARFAMPHWIAADRKSDRLVLTGDDQTWLLVLRFDFAKGTAAVDEAFREPGATQPGISFNRQEWPHGRTGPAVVHGALFGPQ